MLTIDDIPMSIYQQIEANNNTEILYQEVDRYIVMNHKKYIITIKIN
jgi:hypothetical protein